MNPYYNGGAFPATGAPATSASMRAELASISTGFDKLPTLSGNANKLVTVNSSGTALEAVSVLSSLTITDTNLVVEDNADSTRKFRFEASSVSAGAIRVLTVPDTNMTLAGINVAQTFTGVQTLSDNPIINAGTANGVTYLNGSKVLTSGSALTFDGSNLGIGTSLPDQRLTVYTATQNQGVSVYNTTGTGGHGGAITFGIQAGLSLAQHGKIFSSLTNGGPGTVAADMVFQQAIGGSLTEFMRASSGNLGLGVTPRAWTAGATALQLSTFAHIAEQSNGAANVGFGCYEGGSNTFNYTTTGDAPTLYSQLSGDHRWYTAPSGTAGNTISFSQVMTLDASGRLLLGYTSAGEITTPFQIDMATAANPYVTRFANTNTSTAAYCVSRWLQAASGSAVGVIGTGGSTVSNTAFQNTFVVGTQTSNALVFATNNTERARITSGGDLLVGTTSAIQSGKLSVNASGTNGVTCKVDNVINPCFQAWSATTSGNANFVQFATEGTYTTRGDITYNRAGGLVAYNTTSDYRAKDILGPVSNSGATIDALKVYEGQMKGATQSRPMLVAHEAQAVAPYSVTGEKDEVNEDGTPKFQQMDVSSLVPLLIAEIQSLRARVAALEA